jgi:hypothetical protein
MGFLKNNIGFANVGTGGSSSSTQGSNTVIGSNPTVFYKEISSTLTPNITSVASKEAVSDIVYTMSNKTGMNDGDMVEVINLNTSFKITLLDADNSNIDGNATFEVSPGCSITLVLDKENLLWKSVNGI